MKIAKILATGSQRVGAVVLALAVVACGQRGPLVLPTDAAAAQRATLPQTLWGATPTASSAPAASAPRSAP